MGKAFSSNWTIALMLVALPACGDGAQGPADGHPQQHADAAVHDGAPGDGPAPDHLILHYAFEDSATTVTDSSSRHKDGTLTDVAGWTADGRDGRGLKMVGGRPATVYVDLPDGILTDVNDFTISFWVNMNSIENWARVYDIGNGKPDPDNRFMYFTPHGFAAAGDGTMASSFGGSAANEIVAVDAPLLPTGAWKHVAIVGTSGARTIYVDGFPAIHVENGPMVPPHEMEPLAGHSWLGKSRFDDPVDGDPGFNGTLDEFKIYDTALTQTEVADLAKPGTDYSYWRFDEGTGTTAADSSDLDVPTALGTGVTWTAGRLGMALDFPGGAGGATGPAVTLAASPLASCTTELTVAAWVKVDTATNWARVFDFGTGSEDGERFIYLAPTDGAGMHFAMFAPDVAGLDLVAPAPIAADGAWHHVAVTVAADHTVKLYADGAEVASGTTAAELTPEDFASTTENWLGKSHFNADPYLDGAIDELRIGCRALTADEIKMLSRQ